MKEENLISKKQPNEPKSGVTNSKDLFGNRRELAISHNGIIYYLRITGNNKLILNK